MKNFIEELFYGNIDPQARAFKKDSKVKRVCDKINDIEEQLTNTLNKEALTHSLSVLDLVRGLCMTHS